MTISFIIPSMRPIMVKRVLHDLDNQTLKPDRVVLVDNSTRFVNDTRYEYDLEIIRPGKNLGTNPVWNMGLRLEADYCGLLGDDYRLEPQMIEKLLYGLFLVCNGRPTGATVPEIIQQKKRKPLNNKSTLINNTVGIHLGRGKGQCSAVLMRKEVAHKVPLIPDHFNIFFGDNWIGYHIIEKMGLAFMRLRPCYIYHIPGPTNVSAALNYKGTLKHERKFWKQYVRKEAG
jgi:hypothetical protein